MQSWQRNAWLLFLSPHLIITDIVTVQPTKHQKMAQRQLIFLLVSKPFPSIGGDIFKRENLPSDLQNVVSKTYMSRC